MNRAIAQLQSDQLDAAQRDYEALQKLIPTQHRVYYGLGEIAFRRKDVPAAIKHYEAYLKHAPPDTGEEANRIVERLKQLKTSGAP
jgi:tetratricopeptide (TPR) repeat protein